MEKSIRTSRARLSEQCRTPECPTPGPEGSSHTATSWHFLAQRSVGTDKVCSWCRRVCAGSGKEQAEVREAGMEPLVLGTAPSASFGCRQGNCCGPARLSLSS